MIIGVILEKLQTNVLEGIRTKETHYCLLLLDFIGKMEKNITREHVVAYAYLKALTSHWPKLVGDHVCFILEHSNLIFQRETSRVIKQKRICTSQIAATLDAFI